MDDPVSHAETKCNWLAPGSVSAPEEALLATLNITHAEALDDFYNIQQRDTATHRPTKAWLRKRRYRLTASRFECALQVQQRRKALEEMASWPLPEAAHGAEMKFGIVNEGAARDAYERMTGCKVREVGVLISPALPWLGASPDGLVEHNGEIGLLEIKTQQFGMLLDVDERLRRRKSIMTQIMGGLRLVRDILPEVHWCDLFFWSPTDEPQLKRIYWDEKLWLSMYSGLHFFYFSQFLPLWCRWQSENTKNEQKGSRAPTMLQVLYEPKKKKRRR